MNRYDQKHDMLHKIGECIDEYVKNLPTVEPAYRNMDAKARRELYKKNPVNKAEHSTQSVHSVTDYTKAVGEFIMQASTEELEPYGQGEFDSVDKMLTALDTIDQLARYDEEAAWKAYLAFMEANLAGMSIDFAD